MYGHAGGTRVTETVHLILVFPYLLLSGEPEQ
jgi:hypothetical protein